MWKIDGALFLLGCLLVLVGVVDGLRSGASLLDAGRRAWAYAGGVVVVVAVVLGIVLAVRWFEHRAERDLTRKFRK